MPALPLSLRAVARAAGVACGLALAVPAAAAPVLTAAEARIVFTAPETCEVALTLAVTGASDIEHRLETLAGSRTELLDVRGGAPVGDVRAIGRTQALVIHAADASYTLRYRVVQASDRAYRCPIWLPTAPADGRSRAVHLSVAVPAGTSANGTMPSFAWTGPEGAATLGHLPAFVIVPFAAAGTARPWDVSRVMDAAAVGSLVVGTLVWLRRQRGRP